MSLFLLLSISRDDRELSLFQALQKWVHYPVRFDIFTEILAISIHILCNVKTIELVISSNFSNKTLGLCVKFHVQIGEIVLVESL